MNVAVKFVLRVLLVVLLAGFLGATLTRLAPGYGVNEEELDSRLTAESIRILRNNDVEAPDILTFYFRYWGRLIRGDLGISISLHEPVRKLICERFPETMKSVGLGLSLGWVAGLCLAMITVMTGARMVDAGANLLAATVLCIPVAVLALFCIMTHTPGRIAIGMVVFPKIFRFARSLLLRSFGLPHVLTAYAKGLGPWRVLGYHVLPAAAPQLFAVAGVTVSVAFTAAIPVESLCDMPGIGELAWRAAMSRDLQLLVILTMIVTVITLFANCGAEWLGAQRRTSDL